VLVAQCQDTDSHTELDPGILQKTLTRPGVLFNNGPTLLDFSFFVATMRSLLLHERIALVVGCLVVIFRPGDAYFGPAARTGACLTTICFSFCVPVAGYEQIGDIGADVRLKRALRTRQTHCHKKTYLNQDISAGLPAARLTPTASTRLRR
jgi:hypothetical protein